MPALANDFTVKIMNFYVKDLNSSYFPDHMVDLVYIWCDDRYSSKVLFSNTPPPPLPVHGLMACVQVSSAV